ncbi:MAG: tetratricopeptide repeat protein [Phycisphaerae bacterium]
MSRLEQLEKLVRTMPQDPDTHYCLGLELIHLQRWSDASAAFAHAAQLNPRFSAAYYHQARAEIGAGQNEQARATLAAGIEAAKSAGDWHTIGEMQALLETIE